MAPPKLTEYERRRLENIKRNDQMLASLKVHSRRDELSASIKPQRVQTKSYKLSPEKKLKSEPIVIRRSLRARVAPVDFATAGALRESETIGTRRSRRRSRRSRGAPPDPTSAGGLKDDLDETLSKTKTYRTQTTPKNSSREWGPLRMSDAYTGTGSDRKLLETLLGDLKKPQSSISDSKEGILVGSCDFSLSEVTENDNLRCSIRVRGSVDLKSLKLEEEKIARIVPGRIMAVRFVPSVDMRMIVAGNKFGDVGFWNVDSEKEDGYGIYLYHPHSGPVSGIVIHPSSISKMFTCCYDGIIRLMDVEKEAFELVYSSEYAIFSASQRPNDVKSLYFGEGHGGLSIWDERAGKPSTSWNLHQDRINTIDFNPENTNLMATSSTDGTVNIWDLRNISAHQPESLKTVAHTRAVHSAYFSPSGSFLATTSIDDMVGLLSGANYEDISMIYHHNQTGRWISSFRAIWGWDDSHIFIGSMKRQVDVISTAQRNIVATLESPSMSAIPCRFDVHPSKVGTLVGATGGGRVYMWTSC